MAAVLLAVACSIIFCTSAAAQYVPIENPDPIFDDYPQYIDPIGPDEFERFQEQPIVDTPGGDIAVRAWRYAPMVGGLAESNNILSSAATALVVVHPWGIEDGQGWGFPQAYNQSGHAFLGTFSDNLHYINHINDVVKDFVDSMRGRAPLVVYGMPGAADSTRYKLYRDYTHQPSLADRVAGQTEIEDYLSALSGVEFPDKIPVVKNLQYAPGDVAAYDELGYAQLKSHLQSYGIENVLIAGYAADTTLASSTAGYMNLRNDFNVFIVGDATLSTWPLTADPPPGYTRILSRDAIFAATIESGVAATQVSWIERLDHDPAGGPAWRGAERTCMAEWNNWQKPTAAVTPALDLGRAADCWQSNLDPELYGTDRYAGEFDAGKIELVGQYLDRINVARVNDGEELVLHLPDPVDNPDVGRLRVQITWSRGQSGQEPVWTLDLHGGAGGGEELLLKSRSTAANGWLTDVYETELGMDVESTIVHLGFSAGWACIDGIVVDLQMGGINYMDDYEATQMAVNWGKHGAAGMPGDFNGDGWVNEADAAILAAYWLQEPPAATATPEPSTAGLLVTAGCAACFFYRQRESRLRLRMKLL